MPLHASTIESEQVIISPTEEEIRLPVCLCAEFVRARQLAFLAASPPSTLGPLDNVGLITMLIISAVTIGMLKGGPTSLV
jgi:hypothetical protein